MLRRRVGRLLDLRQRPRPAGVRVVTAALGNTGDSPTPPVARQVARTTRHALNQANRALTPNPATRFCWHGLGLGFVNVDVGAQLTAHVSGIQRCGSPWGCLLCAPVIRERRAHEIDEALSAWLSAGNTAALLTLTTRHRKADPLSDRIGIVSTALTKLHAGNPWERHRDATGYVGAIRAVEVTYGRNGWHPHLHALLLFLGRPNLDGYVGWIAPRWRRYLERLGLGTINAHGVDLTPVTTAPELSNYLTKLEGGWSAGHEVARGDLKSGRTPVDLLREFVATGDKSLADLWVEYVTATKGLRAIRWSPGLRARLLGSVDELSDVELAASEGIDLTLVRAIFSPTEWTDLVKAGQAPHVLSTIEQVTAVLLAMTMNPQPLEVPHATTEAVR